MGMYTADYTCSKWTSNYKSSVPYTVDTDFSLENEMK